MGFFDEFSKDKPGSTKGNYGFQDFVRPVTAKMGEWFRNPDSYKSFNMLEAGDGFKDLLGTAVEGIAGGLPNFGQSLFDFGYNPTNDPRIPDKDIPSFNPLGGPAPDTVSGPTTVKPGTITEADVGSDIALKNRTMSNAMRGSQFNPMMNMLEKQRQQMVQRRNAAISAAGRGAAAPYNAAIARLNNEIKKLQDQMPRVSSLFDQKIQNQYDIYDRAGAELETSYDSALAYKSDVDQATELGIRESFTDAQNNAMSVVQNIGADAATAAAVAEEVGRMEASIMLMNEVNAEGIQGIMEASEKLAVTSAIATGATNALDLKRKQIEVESDMKERLQKMIDDRKQQTAARNAAVSAARAMAAARWPQDQPINKSGFQNVSVTRYFGNANVNSEAAGFAQAFISAGMPSDALRTILANTRGGVPNSKAEGLLAQYGFGELDWGAIPANVRGDFSHVATGMEIYYESGNQYENEFKGSDPRDYEQGSAARAMSGQAFFQSQGHSEQDSFYFGREAAEADNDSLGWIDNYKPGGNVGAGSLATGTAQSAQQWKTFQSSFGGGV